VGYFPDLTPDSYLFPFHQVGIAGDARAMTVYGADPNRSMGSWRKAWLQACKRAGLRFRWHDLRHSFVTRLAERPEVSEQTIRALAGHVRCSSITRTSVRAQNRAAIRALKEYAIEPILSGHGQRNGQSDAKTNSAAAAISLKTNSGPARIRTWDQRIMSPLL
jgi:integrase